MPTTLGDDLGRALPTRRADETDAAYFQRLSQDLANRILLLSKRMDAVPAEHRQIREALDTLATESKDKQARLDRLQSEQDMLAETLGDVRDMVASERTRIDGLFSSLSQTESRIIQAIDGRRNETGRLLAASLGEFARTKAGAAALLIVAGALALRIVGVTPTSLDLGEWGAAEFKSAEQMPRESKRRPRPAEAVDSPVPQP